MITTTELIKQIREATAAIQEKNISKPEIGIILGSGLGALVNDIDVEKEIYYQDIPHFPITTLAFHSGKLIFGKLSGRQVVAMQGRFHYYEGYTLQQITFPVRVMKFLGCNTLIISNVCGSLNPLIKKSDIMVMEDHINLQGDNPLRGLNGTELGSIFVDMGEAYSKKLIQKVLQIGMENKIHLFQGVYAALNGPSLETRAEYRFLRIIGADAVGMSSVPETIVAKQMGMDVLGLSVISDECYPDCLKPLTIEEIVDAGLKAEPNLTLLIKELVKEI